LLIEVEVYLERFLFLLRVGVFISSGSYSYPSGSCRSNLINSISVEEELGRAQSKPTNQMLSAQVRRRAAPAFQSDVF